MGIWYCWETWWVLVFKVKMLVLIWCILWQRPLQHVNVWWCMFWEGISMALQFLSLEVVAVILANLSEKQNQYCKWCFDLVSFDYSRRRGRGWPQPLDLISTVATHMDLTVMPLWNCICADFSKQDAIVLAGDTPPIITWIGDDTMAPPRSFAVTWGIWRNK